MLLMISRIMCECESDSMSERQQVKDKIMFVCVICSYAFTQRYISFHKWIFLSVYYDIVWKCNLNSHIASEIFYIFWITYFLWIPGPIYISNLSRFGCKKKKKLFLVEFQTNYFKNSKRKIPKNPNEIKITMKRASLKSKGIYLNACNA